MENTGSWICLIVLLIPIIVIAYIYIRNKIYASKNPTYTIGGLVFSGKDPRTPNPAKSTTSDTLGNIFGSIFIAGIVTAIAYAIIPGAKEGLAGCIGMITFFIVYNWVFTENKKTIWRSIYSRKYPLDWNEIRVEVLKRDRYRCGNCGSTLNLEVHHIVPLAKGGTNELSNLRTICHNCHTKIPKYK